MSEEILKALMQLFAIVTKQDEGASDIMRKYVHQFLVQQVTTVEVGKYFELFEQQLGGQAEADPEGKQRTSVLDSVRTLAICKKINRALSQEQKIIVLVRLFELTRLDAGRSGQRIALLNTVGDVFNVPKEEFAAIKALVLEPYLDGLTGKDLLFIREAGEGPEGRTIIVEQLHGMAVLQRVPSVDLYFMRYEGSSEVMLNGAPLPRSLVRLVPGGSALRIPYGKAIYYSEIVSRYKEGRSTERVSFVADKLWYRFNGGYVGLRDISIQEGSGHLVGIMGASGSGKTTLLNVLCGIEKPTSGTVTINGVDVHSGAKEINGAIGYIPQDDLLIDDLTVYENLMFSARLCLADRSEEERASIVERVLDDLGIAAIKDLQVGDPLNKRISGGQRKRLNIGIELLREPTVLFVDEPTSGLSSLDSENVVDLLRELALKGKLVFVVIHQPSSDIYKMFDRMIFLDVGGHMVYNGDPVEAVEYFKRADGQVSSNNGSCTHCGTVNSEVVFGIIGSKVVDEFGRYTAKRKKSAVEWKALYDAHHVSGPKDDVRGPLAKALHVPSRAAQAGIYFLRDWIAKRRNTQYLLINLLQAPLLAFILAIIIRSNSGTEGAYIFRENQSIPAYLFMCVIVALFMGLMISAEEIFKDRRMLKREALLHLSRSGYLASKVALLFGLSAFQTGVFVLVGNGILGIEGMFLDYWWILFSVQCCACAMGLLLSASLSSAVAIYILVPLLIIPQMILGGAMFSYEKLNRAIGGGHQVPAVAQLMPSRWAYEALAVQQYTRNAYEEPLFAIKRMESDLSYRSEFLIPELRRLVEECNMLMRSKDPLDQARLKADGALLSTELAACRAHAPEVGKDLHASNDNAIPSASAFDRATTYLDELDAHYNALYRKAEQKKEALIAAQQATPEGRAAFAAVYDAHFNEGLSDVVRKLQEPDKITRSGDRLQQVLDPVYTLPEPSLTGLDAHFYAPVKYLMNVRFGTLAFNAIIIWLFSGALLILLYVDALRSIGKAAGKWIGRMKARLLRATDKEQHASAGALAQHTNGTGR